MLWYPVKSRRAADNLASASRRSGRRRRRSPENACGWSSASDLRPLERRLASAGLLIVNPPWTLSGELKSILPELQKPLGQGGAGRFRLETPKPLDPPAPICDVAAERSAKTPI